jgi:hypothetical protein
VSDERAKKTLHPPPTVSGGATVQKSGLEEENQLLSYLPVRRLSEKLRPHETEQR